MPALKNGDKINLTENRAPLTVLDFIAGGGQGEVYRVRYGAGEYAMKWYGRAGQTDAFYANLGRNVKLGAPNNNFLWPLALTEKTGAHFGYVMRLKPECYKDFGDYLLSSARFESWNALLKAALNITVSFMELHSRGYSYQDINEGSFFIRPDGAVLICDNDNIAANGRNLGVRGTPKYMAPEVALGLKAPDTHSDRYSLAVILFRLFYIDHPLEGSYTAKFPLTDAIGAQLFGENPVFVYDPNNPKNRPDPQAHPNVIARWPLFPPDITAAFTKAFTKGLKDIHSRVTELQWAEALIKARGMLVTLDGQERFVNAYDPASLPEGVRLMATDRHVFALAPGSPVYTCQTDVCERDYFTLSGITGASKTNGRVLGLKNLTQGAWTLNSGGTAKEIPPQAAAPLIPGDVINFGNTEAKIY